MQDLIACVRLYRALNDESFIPTSEEQAIQSIIVKARAGTFIRIAVDDSGTILAWILCEAMRNPAFGFNTFHQTFFASKETGFKSARAVKLLHEAMLEEAERRRFPMAISQGSHFDTDFTFTRLLEKFGWRRAGFVAVKETRWWKAPRVGQNGTACSSFSHPDPVVMAEPREAPRSP